MEKFQSSCKRWAKKIYILAILENARKSPEVLDSGDLLLQPLRSIIVVEVDRVPVGVTVEPRGQVCWVGWAGKQMWCVMWGLATLWKEASEKSLGFILFRQELSHELCDLKHGLVDLHSPKHQPMSIDIPGIS